MNKILWGSTHTFVVVLPVLGHRFEASTKNIDYLLPDADQISDPSNLVDLRARIFLPRAEFRIVSLVFSEMPIS